MTDQAPEVNEKDSHALQVAILQEQTEAKDAELRRLNDRVVTLRLACNNLAEENDQLKRQLAAANGQKTRTKNKKKGK